MYVLKKLLDAVQHIELDDFNQGTGKFNWKYDMHSSEPDDTSFVFNPQNHRNSDLIIHEFLKSNVKGQTNYNLDQFQIRASYGYGSNSGHFSMIYHVDILRWNNPHIHELDPSSKVFN